MVPINLQLTGGTGMLLTSLNGSSYNKYYKLFQSLCRKL